MSLLVLMIVSSLALFIHQSRSFQIIINHYTPSLRTRISSSSSSPFHRRHNHNINYNLITPFQSMSTNSNQEKESVADVNVVASNLKYVQDCITKCAQDCNRSEGSVDLVAVSKTKPNELLIDAYNVSAFTVERSANQNRTQNESVK